MSDEALLENRDYTVIIAKTAPSVAQTPPGFEARWTNAHAAIVALAERCQILDPDGITVYLSCRSQGGFVQYRQVTTEKLAQIFDLHYPPEELNLLDGLQTALADYFDRKVAGKAKPNGEIIIVLIDGEPKNRMGIAKAITQATEKMERDQELGIGFAQVGNDLIARGFLDALDDNLRSAAGAKFDIVNTRVLEEIKPNSLTEFLLDIIRN